MIKSGFSLIVSQIVLFNGIGTNKVAKQFQHLSEVLNSERVCYYSYITHFVITLSFVSFRLTDGGYTKLPASDFVVMRAIWMER